MSPAQSRAMPCQNSRRHQRGINQAWDVDADLDWPQAIDRKDYPFLPSLNRFAGFPSYAALPRHRRVRIAWEQHTQDMVDVLFGEQIAGRLVVAAISVMEADGDRRFLQLQAVEERRHVAFFARYLALITGAPPTPSPGLQALAEAACALEDPMTGLLLCQGVLEPVALLRFRELHDHTRIPLLRRGLRLISRDEARHTGFARDFFPARVAALEEPKRHRLAARAEAAMRQLLAEMEPLLTIGATHGLDRRLLSLHLRRARVTTQPVRRRWTRQLPLLLGRLGLCRQAQAGAGSGVR